MPDFATFDCPAVDVTVTLPATWTAGQPLDSGRARSWTVTGLQPGEGFAVVRLDDADAASRLAGWIELPMAVTGGVDPELRVGTDRGELTGWSAIDAAGALSEHDADECVRYAGRLRVAGQDLRVDAMALRRGTVAWKLALTVAPDSGVDLRSLHLARRQTP